MAKDYTEHFLTTGDGHTVYYQVDYLISVFRLIQIDYNLPLALKREHSLI